MPTSVDPAVDGPIEELILSGTAFGFGLFNLVFSLLPAKVKGVVGFFGFHHDRKLALRALAVSAAKKDVHSVFAGYASSCIMSVQLSFNVFSDYRWSLITESYSYYLDFRRTKRIF